MAVSNFSRIEPLGKSNYDTWKLQMQAILVKSDLWEYVSGIDVKPTPTAENLESVNKWTKNDQKAKSDIILSISSNELKQVKNCETSRDMWIRLQEIYQSKGPAREATLLKSLILCKMADNGDAREHLNNFFDSVDKLSDMEVAINPDLLTILVLYSLPETFDVFRCAIESRDELPSPEALRIKIIEESDARKNNGQSSTSGAMFAKNSQWKNGKKRADVNKSRVGKNKFEHSEFRCFRCKNVGHKASECRSKPKNQPEQCAKNVCLQICSSTKQNRNWCLDSGATTHLCNNPQQFDKITSSKRGTLNLADLSTTETTNEGTVKFVTNVHGSETTVSLQNTLLAPDLRTNLLSVSKITDHDFEVLFRKNEAVILNADGEVQLYADREGDLYFVRESECANLACPLSKEKKIGFQLLHRRLGHSNARDIHDAVKNKYVTGVKIDDSREASRCDVCLKGKMSRTPFPKRSDRLSDTLEIVHTDVCGPMRKESMGHAKYYVEFIDDKTKWCEVRFIKSKSDVAKATKEYIALVEKQQGKTVKCLQSDNGGEYLCKELDEYLKRRGIARRLTIPHNPEQNGTAERKNRTLLDTARCLLLESKLPEYLWAEAVNTANYIRNRLPTKSLGGRTPYQEWTGTVPDLSHCRVFGCRVIYLNREPGKGKFDPRGEEGIFVGYADESKGYRIWSPSKRKVLISRDVKFFESCETQVMNNKPTTDEYVSENSESTPPLIDIEHYPLRKTEEVPTSAERPQGEATNPPNSSDEGGSSQMSESESESDDKNFPDEKSQIDRRLRAPGRPKILRTGQKGRPRKLFRSVQSRDATDDESVELIGNVFLSEVPMREAMTSTDAHGWHQAIDAEIKSVIKNDTFELVDRPPDVKVIGSRVVLRKKFNPDGTVERKKARLVAQGFSQQPGVHFFETFSPVARSSSIRLMVSLAASHGMALKHFDVATAYLNGELSEEIFMEPPKGLKECLENIAITDKDNAIGGKAKQMLRLLQNGDKVCLLKKSLYGLRQAGRSWYNKLSSTLKELGAKATTSDPCFFHIGSGCDATLIAVYVDDIIIASRCLKKIDVIEKFLASRFEIKNLGDIKFCLGIEFNREDDVISMKQRSYINDVLERFGMSDCKPVVTPVEAGSRLMQNKEQTSEDLKLPYRELVGALMYLATSTRPDIAFAASMLGQFNNCYGTSHWKAAKRVLRYLKGTQDLGLTFGPHTEPMEAFVDADWGGCADDRRSYSGFIFTMNGGPVSWNSKKQKTVALSTTESEYMALSECVKESIFLTRFLRELGFGSATPPSIFCDNMSALKLAENPTFHSRSKHIDIRHHFVRDALQDNLVTVKHVPTELQIGDYLTKGLPRVKYNWCVESSGMEIIA